MKKLIIAFYSTFAMFFLRLRGLKISHSSYIGGHRHIKNPKKIRIGKNVRIHDHARISCYTDYQGMKLNPKIIIGDDVYINAYALITAAGAITIEDHVIFGSHVTILDENHGLNPMVPSYMDTKLEVSPVTIKEGAWIGNNVIILPGVTIGKKAVIGAGSVVTKDIPDYTIAVGNPAKPIKCFDLDEKVWKRL